MWESRQRNPFSNWLSTNRISPSVCCWCFVNVSTIVKPQKGLKTEGIGKVSSVLQISTETLHRERKHVVPEQIHPKDVFPLDSVMLLLNHFLLKPMCKTAGYFTYKSRFQGSLGYSEDPGDAFPVATQDWWLLLWWDPAAFLRAEMGRFNDAFYLTGQCVHWFCYHWLYSRPSRPSIQMGGRRQDLRWVKTLVLGMGNENVSQLLKVMYGIYGNC